MQTLNDIQQPFAEEFLHYVWQHRLFNQSNLNNTQNQAIKILNPGILNHNAGPDFNNAKIEIDNTLWAGNVEIHIESADWQRHNHHHNKAYDSVILHVVWQNNANVFRTNGTQIQTLELKNLINPKLIAQHHYLKNNQNWIPCQQQLPLIDAFVVQQWLQRVLVERLAQKAQSLFALNQQLNGNWEQTFYITLAQNFGFKVNALPFTILAQSLPQQILAKHKNNPLQIEALIFGQAGFLEDDFEDFYPKTLQQEYAFLSQKYNLKPIDKTVWKFSKLRPNNFPTIRLAQFAAVVSVSSHLFSKVLEASDLKALKMLFSEAKINPYWQSHFQFNVASTTSTKNLGNKSLDLIIINTIAVITFCYGKHSGNEAYVNNALNLLEQLKPEDNHIITGFKNLGINALSAFETQALIELKNNFCDKKKCLHCGIGNKILNS